MKTKTVNIALEGFGSYLGMEKGCFIVKDRARVQLRERERIRRMEDLSISFIFMVQLPEFRRLDKCSRELFLE